MLETSHPFLLPIHQAGPGGGKGSLLECRGGAWAGGGQGTRCTWGCVLSLGEGVCRAPHGSACSLALVRWEREAQLPWEPAPLSEFLCSVLSFLP